VKQGDPSGRGGFSLEAFEATSYHEQRTPGHINKLISLAMGENDHITSSFLLSLLNHYREVTHGETSID
jgi:ferritin